MKCLKNLFRLLRLVAVSLATGLALTACVHPAGSGETQFPKRSVELVVPFSAGGATDLVARSYAGALEKALGTTVVVVNRPGASTSVGATEVANARPDGYTVMLATTTTFSTTPLVQDVAYAASDFMGIAGVADQPFVIVSGQGSGISSGDDLRSISGGLTYGVDAVGNNAHLSVASLLGAFEVTGDYVPFSSSQETITAVMGGQVQLAPADPNIANTQIDNGKVTAIAVTSEERLDEYPDVPTTGELTDGQVEPSMGRYALVAPEGIDSETLATLTSAAAAATNDESYRTFLEEKDLLPPEFSNGESWLGEMIPHDQRRARDILDELGLSD